MSRRYAGVHEKNIASCCVLEKAGFARVGALREHYLINGVPEKLMGSWKRNPLWTAQARVGEAPALEPRTQPVQRRIR